MNHPDKYIAKRYDTPNRSKDFTDIVYRDEFDGTKSSAWKTLNSVQRSLDPPAPELLPDKVLQDHRQDHNE